jgi:transposase-like protein
MSTQAIAINEVFLGWGGGYFSQPIFFYTEGKRHIFCLETFHFLNVLIAQQEGIAVFLQCLLCDEMIFRNLSVSSECISMQWTICERWLSPHQGFLSLIMR